MRIPSLQSLLATVALLPLLSVSGDQKLKENDHKSLSKLAGSYFTAYDEKKDINKTLGAFLDQITATEKRMKGQKVLSFVSDWEEVFRLVTESRLAETLKKKGAVADEKIEQNGTLVTFAYCVPKKPIKGALPLILTICDAGEAPSAHLNTHWNDPAVREGAILMAVKIDQDPETWGMFGSPDNRGGVFTVMSALGIIRDQFSVDVNRTYLAGSGKGFAAAEWTACSFPHVFAGVIGIGDVSISDAANLANFGTMLLLKGKEGAKAIHDKIEELGSGTCTLDPEGGAAKAWEWINQNRRTAYPAKISFSPRSEYSKMTSWLSVDSVQLPETNVKATVDRASNTITVDVVKASQLVIYLNDELVDLDKPVRFVVNGTTHEQTVERNAPEMIKLQRSSGDWGRVFTAFVTQDVPAKK